MGVGGVGVGDACAVDNCVAERISRVRNVPCVGGIASAVASSICVSSVCIVKLRAVGDTQADRGLPVEVSDTQTGGRVGRVDGSTIFNGPSGSATRSIAPGPLSIPVETLITNTSSCGCHTAAREDVINDRTIKLRTDH